MHVAAEHAVEIADVAVSGSTAITETDGFSLYTVEFTYNEMQYVLEGGAVCRSGTSSDLSGS